MKDTSQAISILQAYVNTQQPLLDIIKQTIQVLDANYQAALLTGDLKTANETIIAKEATIEEHVKTIDSLVILKADLEDQLNIVTTEKIELQNQLTTPIKEVIIDAPVEEINQEAIIK